MIVDTLPEVKPYLIRDDVELLPVVQKMTIFPLPAVADMSVGADGRTV
jgi:hypothetical protein